MWKNESVSVVLPTYRDVGSIHEVIEDFFSTGYVDELIVVDNNAERGTDELVRATKAKLVFEHRQGLGHAIRRGLEEAMCDLIIVCEPDGTFTGQDIIKLLAYTDHFDVVFGTLTTKELIWSGANMGWFLRWGNYAVAKMLEFSFNTCSLSDVGCTMRLIRRNALEKIKGKLTVGGSHFNPEFMIMVFINKIKAIEIPVNYKRRVGESTITGSMIKAFLLGIRMSMMIFSYWFRWKLGLLKQIREAN